MRYLICKNNIQHEEIKERQKYIYDVFHIYTFVDTKNSSKKVIVLKSMPYTSIDLFFVIGHDKSTDEYLKENYKKIQEKNILIISCNTKYFSSIKLLTNKNVYIPREENIVNTYSGNDYGFRFDITDEEIRIYRNRNKELEEILNKIFRRL